MFDLRFHVSEYFVDHFVQVASLKHFHYSAIERLINRIDSNDVSVFVLNLYRKSNPSSRLNLRQIQILEFFGHYVSNASSSFLKEGLLVHPTPSIESETSNPPPPKARSNSYGLNEQLGGGGGGGGLVGSGSRATLLGFGLTLTNGVGLLHRAFDVSLR